MKSLADLSAECHQSIKVISFLLILTEINCILIVFSFSMIVTTPRSNLTKFLTPGGTTKTEMRNITGPEITRPEFTPVNAESMKTVSILR
jgi:hypothetical protein